MDRLEHMVYLCGSHTACVIHGTARTAGVTCEQTLARYVKACRLRQVECLRNSAGHSKDKAWRGLRILAGVVAAVVVVAAVAALLRCQQGAEHVSACTDLYQGSTSVYNKLTTRTMSRQRFDINLSHRI